MEFQIPKGAQSTLDTLHAAGFEAYVVGGCVRDTILGRTPKDWDITTDAEPAQIKALFPVTFDTGLEHGTVTVRQDGMHLEVTTYREDGAYTDHRHPDHVTYTRNLKEDLKRRDFTINAMAYCPEKGIIDLFGGQSDLKRGIIRAVGQPTVRFTEDALRMLRAYRFAARFGFQLAFRTKHAIRKLAPTLKNVSAERIREEMNGLMEGTHPELLRELVSTGLMREILPEFYDTIGYRQNTPYHQFTVDEHTYRVFEHVPSDDADVRVLRWAALLHDLEKPHCETTDDQGVSHFKAHPTLGAQSADRILRRLKFDNATREQICEIILYHDIRPKTLQEMRRLLSRMQPQTMPLLLKFQRADALGKYDKPAQDSLDTIETTAALYEQVLSENGALRVTDLAIDGDDLLAMGFSGKPIGTVLEDLLDRVLDDPSLNTKDTLLAFAQSAKENNHENV